MGQWVTDSHDGIPELAFQVSDDWQKQGLGTYLMQRLVEIAKASHLPKLKAEILAQNRAILQVLKRVNEPLTKKVEFGIIKIELDIRPKPQ